MRENIKIGIIGLGYVGLPLAVEFGKQYHVVGFDISQKRISELKNGIDKTNESSLEQISSSKNLVFSNDPIDLKSCTIYIVTVPTPINQFKAPDLEPLKSASSLIATVLKKGDIVIYESTVYPGCTEEECVPILEKKSGLNFNIDFYCGYSPERINPGDKINTLTKIKKVTSGSNPIVAEKIDLLYKSIIEAGTHKASSIKVAEASKAIENAQRDINISFVNELALIFERMGIDTNEVLEAAGTKWNFLKYKPGLVGGHCIGVDPYYLAHKAQTLGYHPEVILSGRRVNDNMGNFIANKLIKLMIQNKINISESKVLILGITFKENCPDIRNSKVIDIYNELLSYHITTEVYDTHADFQEVKNEYSINLITNLSLYDGIIIAVPHEEFKNINYKLLKKNSSTVLIDVKSFLPINLSDYRL